MEIRDYDCTAAASGEGGRQRSKVNVIELTMETLLKTQQLNGDPVKGTADLNHSF